MTKTPRSMSTGTRGVGRLGGVLRRVRRNRRRRFGSGGRRASVFVRQVVRRDGARDFGRTSPVGFEPPAIVCGDDEKDDLFALLVKKQTTTPKSSPGSPVVHSRPRSFRFFIPRRPERHERVERRRFRRQAVDPVRAGRCASPGVHPSLDGATVAQPVTLVEWYAGFYEHACRVRPGGDERRRIGRRRRGTYGRSGTGSGRSPVAEKGSRVKNRRYSVREGTCRAGGVLFVPSGWWHAALNLTETAAVTQNFCSPRTAPRTLRFLKRAAAAGKNPEPGPGRRPGERAGVPGQTREPVR